MAVDKLVDSTQLDADLTSVANAIRTKGGTSAQMAFPAGFVSAVQAIPTGGGGGGATTIASGSFVGSNSYTQTFAIGTKMAQTDVFVKVLARSNSEFTYDTSYKFANFLGVVFSGIAHFDLSTNGSEKAAVSDLSYPVNNSGTITNVVAGDSLRGATNIRNASSNIIASVNQFRVTKKNSGFELYIGHSNGSYKFPSTITYDYEVVYFGSNPSTDIVEVA